MRGKHTNGRVRFNVIASRSSSVFLSKGILPVFELCPQCYSVDVSFVFLAFPCLGYHSNMRKWLMSRPEDVVLVWC